ncbi:hypothetical protein G4B88_008186 [Cannabis sativa]|uniref:Uncharacterized protein n=1 Tax=Cannabis sativa TaxID=3483 RepID=A0A7J6ETC6_CANSA|nr:hypothetical protein G4B88_008186 [Cannabis sativa]
MNEALDLYEKGLHAARTRECMLELKELKSKTLRFISAVHLQMGEFESVIKCVKVLREGDNEDRHPSLPVLALKAWLGLRRFAEAEKELRGMVVNKGIPESVWVSSVEAYFQAAGTAVAETAKEVFLGLFISRSRRHQDPEPVDRFQRFKTSNQRSISMLGVPSEAVFNGVAPHYTGTLLDGTKLNSSHYRGFLSSLCLAKLC